MIMKNSFGLVSLLSALTAQAHLAEGQFFLEE
jgi:hypothetical protein